MDARGVCLFFIIPPWRLLFGRAAAKLLISLFFLIRTLSFVRWSLLDQDKIKSSLPCRFAFFSLFSFFSFFPPCPPSFLFPHLFLSLLFSFSLPLFFPFVWQHFDVRLNCSARRIRFQVINNMWATAPRNLYFAGHKPPKYRKFRQSYQHFIVEILIFVEKCVTIDV